MFLRFQKLAALTAMPGVLHKPHGALSRHRTNDCRCHDRNQVRKSAVKSELTLFRRTAPLRPLLTEPVRQVGESLPSGTVQKRRFLRASDGAILKAVNKWLERLPLWKFAVLNASALILIETIMCYGLGLGIRWLVTRGVMLTILLTGSQTLSFYLWKCRRRERGSTGPGR
jgi:hypothetical protein